MITEQPTPTADFAALGAQLGAILSGMVAEITRQASPVFAHLQGQLQALDERYPGLFVEDTPDRLFERVMEAKRNRNTGPAQRRLDGVGW